MEKQTKAEFDQNIYSLISETRESLLACFAELVQKSQELDSRISVVGNAEILTELKKLVNSITDPTYKKQLKNIASLGTDGRFDFARDDVQQLWSNLKKNVDALNSSKIPNWLSSCIYTFSHNWRREISIKIICDYSKIKEYFESDVATKTEDIEKKKMTLVGDYKIKAFNIVNQMLEQLKNKTKILSNKGAFIYEQNNL